MPKRSASEYPTDPNEDPVNSNHVNPEHENQNYNIPVIKKSKIIPCTSLSNTTDNKPLVSKTTSNVKTPNKIYKVVSINGQIMLMEQDVSNLNSDTDNKNDIDNGPVVHNKGEGTQQQNEHDVEPITTDNNAENILTDSSSAIIEEQIDNNLDLNIDHNAETNIENDQEEIEYLEDEYQQEEPQQNKVEIDLTVSDTEDNVDSNPVAREHDEITPQKSDLTIKNHNEHRPKHKKLRGYTQTNYIVRNTNQDTYELFAENHFKYIHDKPQENVNVQKNNVGTGNINEKNNLDNKKPHFRNVYQPKKQNLEPPRILNLEHQGKENIGTKPDELEIVLDNQHGSAIIRPANSSSGAKDKSPLPNRMKQGASVAGFPGNPTKSSKKPDVNTIIEDFVDYFADIMNYKWYNDQDILIYGKKGTAMALVHEAKYKAYKANKAKLEELNAAMEIIKRSNHLIAYEKTKIELCFKKYQEQCKLDKNNNKTLLDETLKENVELKACIKKHNDEMKELQTLKHYISKAFSEAQIALLTHQMRSKSLWNDEDMKKAVFLYQIVSPKAYTYLKTSMKFPLPSRNTIHSWMREKNIYVKPKRGSKESSQDINNTTLQVLNESKIQLTQDSNVSVQTVDESNIQAEDASLSNIENEYVMEANKPLNESNITQYQEEHNINVETNMNEDANESTAILVNSNFHSQYAQNVVLLQDTNTEVTETQQAVNMIAGTQQMCQIDGQNVLATPAYSDGEMILVYLDDNNVNADYVIEDNCIEDNCVEGETYAQDNNIENDNDNAADGDEVHDDDNTHNDNDVYENNEAVDNAGNDNGNVDDNNEAHNNNGNITLTSVEEILKWDMEYIKNSNGAKKNLHMLSRMLNWKRMCQLCLKPFETEEELRQHVPIHYFNTYCTTYLDVQKPYQCEFCHERVVQKTSLVRHHCMHLGITSYHCWYPGCTYVGRNRELLSTHCVRHYPRKHRCPSCEACFGTQCSLRSHYKRRHSTRGVHICELCNAILKSDYTFHLHMRSHNNLPRFKCPVDGCTEAFYSRRSLGVHKLTHMSDTRPYKCPHCPLATYTHEFLLRKHMKNHEKYRLAHCSKCQQIFDTYTDYYTHLKSDEHKKIAKYTCVCKQDFSNMRQFKRHKLECQLVIDNDTSKKKKRRKIIEKPININEQIKEIETKKPQIIQNENSEQIDVCFDGNVVKATYQRNKTEDIVEQHCNEPETGLHQDSSQTSEHEIIAVPKRTYLSDNNTVSNKIIVQKVLMTKQHYDAMKQNVAQQKVTVEPIFSSQDVTLLANSNETENRNLIQEQKLTDISKEKKANKINIQADSLSTSGNNQHASRNLIEYQQTESELSNTQTDMPVIDQYIKQDIQALCQINKSQSKIDDDRSKNNDVIGALMKQSGCVEQTSKGFEENFIGTEITSQQDIIVNESIEKVTAENKTTSQNLTSVNVKIPEAKVVVLSNKTYYPNRIIESKTRVVPKVIMKKHVMQINREFLSSSSQRTEAYIKKDIIPNHHIQINKNKPNSGHINVAMKRSPQKNNVLIPITDSQPDMPLIDHIGEETNIQHDLQSLHQINQSQCEAVDINSKDKPTIGQNLEQHSISLNDIDPKDIVPTTVKATIDTEIYEKQLTMEANPTTNINNVSETDKNNTNVILEQSDVTDTEKAGPIITTLKPNILKKSSLTKFINFKIKPISEYLSNNQNMSNVIKHKLVKTNSGIKRVKYVPKVEYVVHSTTSAQTLQEQHKTDCVDQIEEERVYSTQTTEQVPVRIRKCCRCGSLSTDPNVVLFRYPNPRKNPMMRCEKWAKYMFPKRKSSSPDFHYQLYTEHRMLCDKHFNDTSFVDYTKKELHKNAIPDESLWYNIK